MGLAEELQDETAEVLSSLIRFKTVNPPGNERECLEWLAGYLEDAGLEVELAGAEPERPEPRGDATGGETGRSSATSRHVDTVLADNEDWSADPWGAEIRDGFLYGRGTIDMKNQTAAEAVAAAHLARAGAQLQRHAEGDRVADEETGGAARRQVDHREPARTSSRVDYLLNEGAGAVMPYGDRRLYGVCVAEKGTFRFNVATTGTAAHASVPGPGRATRCSSSRPLITRSARAARAIDLTEATQRAASRRSARIRTDPKARARARSRAVEPRLAAAARRRDARHVRADDRLARARRST